MFLKDFKDADEIFCTGNIAKIMPVERFEDKIMKSTKLSNHARDLYWDFALSKYAQQNFIEHLQSQLKVWFCLLKGGFHF